MGSGCKSAAAVLQPEVLSVFRNHFKYDWVRGDLIGKDITENTLAHDSDALKQPMESVIMRTKNTLLPPPNYDKIHHCKQKDGEGVFEFRERLEEVFKAHRAQRSGFKSEGRGKSRGRDRGQFIKPTFKGTGCWECGPHITQTTQNLRDQIREDHLKQPQATISKPDS